MSVRDVSQIYNYSKTKDRKSAILLDSMQHKYFYPHLALQLQIKLISSIAKLFSNEMGEERKPTKE